MRARPLLRAALVGVRAPEIDQDEDNEDGDDDEFLVEVVDRHALPHAVPFRVGTALEAHRGAEEGIEPGDGGV